MAEVFIVTYSSCGKSYRCICNINCKRQAVNLARSKSKSGSRATVWKSNGVWSGCPFESDFHDIDSVNVCTYDNGKRVW
jgi:hypothetical protein